MKPSSEREAFSQRLLDSLRSAACPESPTVLAREFNHRIAGSAITVHAARKWLVGEAIPTQEKLRILAEWLSVDVHWLRFGDPVLGHCDVQDVSIATPDDESAQLVREVSKLGEQHQIIVRQVIRMLARMARAGQDVAR
jgi:hypothetical protein